MKSAGTTFAHPVALAPRRDSCPHCTASRIQRWGRFSGRQRYRCLACRRTFSTFTGTALHYIKRAEAWASFVLAVKDSLTVREAARVAGIHRDTAFRWRHRFLHAVEKGDRVVLRDQAAVGSTWFRYSRKGQKGLPRPAAMDTVAPQSLGTGRVWAILATGPGGLALNAIVGDRHPSARVLSDSLRHRVAPGTRIRSRRGRYSSESACARRLRLPFERFALPPSSDDPEPIREHAVRIKRWMRRFHGVATRYLSHYLSWFQVMDSGWSPSGWDLRLVAMAGHDRQSGSLSRITE